MFFALLFHDRLLIKSPRHDNLRRTRDPSGADAMLVIFFSVLFLYYTGLVGGQCPISNCKDEVFADNTCTCTQCNGGYYSASATVCYNCYFDCRTCEDNYCFSCAYNDCNEYINCTCSSQGCSQNTFIACPSCPNGYFLDRGRCYRCLNSDCKCSYRNQCTGCLPGRHGPVCNETCPVGCKICYNSSNCTECFQGKYGETCDKNCKSMCKNGACDKQSGLCCNDIYYQAFDNVTYDYECRHCPVNCVTCKSATQCTSCKPSYWGTYCQHYCTGCSTDCTNQGCFSCKSRYHNQRTSDGFECIKCLDHCKVCSGDTTCDECDYGYIVHDGTCYPGNFTVSCSTNCKNGNCDQKDGKCIEGCLDGWSGDHCNASCPSGCQHCKQVNALSCDACKIGFYGKSCEHSCSIYCKRVEGQLICNKDSGACAHGCLDGYWGNYCTKLCGKGCTGLICNDTNGDCLNGCKISYYGLLCEEECTSTCQRTSRTLRLCSENSGECLYGCTRGWYGSKCNLRCSDACQSQTCLQHTGSCIVDHSASITETGITTELNTSSESNSRVNIALAVITGIAVLVTVVAITCSVVQFKRRRKDSHEKTSNTCSNIVPGQELSNNGYQDLNREETADRPYATVDSEYENPV